MPLVFYTHVCMLGSHQLRKRLVATNPTMSHFNLQFDLGYDNANQTAYLDDMLRWGLNWLIRVNTLLHVDF